MVFRQKPIDKQGESEIRTWIKKWVDDSAATKARFLAGSWSADSGDEMLRNVKPNRGPSLASVEMRTTLWVLFSALREEKILRRKRGARNIMHVLYPD